MADVLIRGVTLPSGVTTDLAVSGGVLVDPGSVSQPATIDGSGLIALPGLVDLHTHLREPSPTPAETIETGTLAAARGGFTGVFAMANTNPVTDTAESVRHLLRLAEASHAEVIPVGAITTGLAGEELCEIEPMWAEGVTYFSDDGFCVMDADLMREALQRVKAFNGVIGQHSQDCHLAGASACFPDEDSLNIDHPSSDTIWPGVAEAVIVARDVQLALDTGARVHICHVSTAESVEVVRWAKAQGAPITAEVTPHHLLLDCELLMSMDTRFKVNPPLRGWEDREELKRALAEGILDIVATDHAPHLPSDKDKPFPQAKPGMVGLEWALGIVIETMVKPGLLDWAGIADRMSYTPARIGKITSRQGRPLIVGEPATFTLIDPNRHAVVDRDDSYSMGRNNPYHGLNLPSPVLATFWAGRTTYQDPDLPVLS
ncbi:MAG: dihydroorotase [Propionibacteriaceae bacterium]|nr:dihydroorotase [Propionibacteriaceae bacterium]